MTEINLPKIDDFLAPILRYASDEKEHNISDTIDEMSRQFNLSEEQQNILMPDGKRRYVDFNINWAITYLVKAGLLVRTGRSRYMISDKGKKEVKIIPERISSKYLEKFDSFNKFKKGHSQRRNISGDKHSIETRLTPDEEIDSIFRNRDNILAQELLRNLIKIKPSDFERVIIDVILALGYGKNFEEMANVLGKPNDQGIDGEFPQDKLGFEKIYLLAKRWNIEQTVRASQIRDFIGDLTIKHLKKGIFITTAKFSKDALKTAKKDSDHNIILIDGNELAKLMIEYNVGVREIKKYKIKEIDKDYFEYLEE